MKSMMLRWRAVNFRRMISRCQSRMPRLFRQLQEMQATQFQLIASMPFYLIRLLPVLQTDTDTVDLWSHRFTVPDDLATRRLDQIRRRILQREFDLTWAAAERPPAPREEPTGIVVTHPETERLLQQLHRQLKIRNAF